MPRPLVLLASILLCVTALLGLTGTLRAAQDARDIERLVTPVSREVSALASSGHPMATKLRWLGRQPVRLRLAAVLLTLVAVGAISALVLALHGHGLPWAPISVAVLALAAMAASPHYELGPGTPWSARQWALATTLAALTAAALWGRSSWRPTMR